MTYFGFLAIFLGIPILVLSYLTWRDAKQGRALAAALSTYPAGFIILLHVAIALIYTTPWDNYLVATRVWWYDPELVTGLTIGWVPIEEYTFFILQPILAGLWLLFLARRTQLAPNPPPDSRWRRRALLGVGLIWFASLVLLLSQWQPGTYLALELVWALPPIMLQLIFGADILRQYWRLVLPAILIPTLYLSAADALAINAGTWTINPAQSLDLHILGILPLEELLFFLLTNTLVVFGVTLALARASAKRFQQVKDILVAQPRPGTRRVNGGQP